jgi:catechol 2,3-dioxygenase-like lactoylglutathione lyase family enzyme
MAASLDFNHAMIYSRDLSASLGFYQGILGLDLLEEYRHRHRVVYARLRSPGSNSTIALHALEPGRELNTGGVRLYFEVRISKHSANGSRPKEPYYPSHLP